MNTVIPQSVVFNEDDLEILTPDGYKPFFGVNKIEKSEYYYLSFTNGKELTCSSDHPFVTIDGIIKTKDLDETMEILTKNGGCFITRKELVKENIFLYDIVNSGPKHTYYTNDIISHNCNFLGSVDTLINPNKLRVLVYEDPLKKNAGLHVYEEAIAGHDYVMTVDAARGVGADYSAFIVIDVTSIPYKVVAKYKNNEIKPMLFPNIIDTTARHYNKASTLVEVNDIGGQVADILQFDLEYDNLLMCAMKGRAGQIVGTGFSTNAQLGVKMTRAVKKYGCANLKALIEDDKLLVPDYDIISELTTFISRNDSFGAEEGCNDDLAMCMVIFSWLSTQPYFRELTSNDVRQRIFDDQRDAIEQDMAPFGFVLDGLNDDETEFVDTSGDYWVSATDNKWIVDEFGDRSFMWDYR